jgi:hypothetical protein
MLFARRNFIRYKIISYFKQFSCKPKQHQVMNWICKPCVYSEQYFYSHKYLNTCYYCSIIFATKSYILCMESSYISPKFCSVVAMYVSADTKFPVPIFSYSLNNSTHHDPSQEDRRSSATPESPHYYWSRNSITVCTIARQFQWMVSYSKL